jgi:hypothetical protein
VPKHLASLPLERLTDLAAALLTAKSLQDLGLED